MPLSKSKKTYLDQLYSDPSKIGSLSGISALSRAIKKEGKYNISHKDLTNWFESNQTYSLHKPVIRKFKREPVIVSGPNIEWDIDLGDMRFFEEFNNGYNYFLLVIDDFSKFVYTRALKTKTGKEVTQALKSILVLLKEPPTAIRCDQGGEFLNVFFKRLLSQNNIKLITTQNELKACIAERCIKTIKNRIFRYFTETDQLDWSNVLPDITNSYNKSYQRSIKMPPEEVNEENMDSVWHTLHPMYPWKENKKFKFNINDKVRISGLRKPFTREYDMKWSREFFIVADRFWKGQIPKYKLKDFANEEISGTFYESELQKIQADDNTIYIIDKIVGRRTRNGRRELLIHWLGWPSKFDSYIPANQVKNYADLRQRRYLT